ncbi:serine hydrolase FSH [Chaetomium sp. MPI-SDFR-AT-0129]|nr:serine hydrolase FSH [Chaetomium sp. MPI-SDFR-AT-0129]
MTPTGPVLKPAVDPEPPTTGSPTLAPSDTTTPTTSGTNTPAPKPPKRRVRILMLHGYTQSGPNFAAKTGALRKKLAPLFAARNQEPIFIYPTAPLPAQVDETASTDVLDAWAWWRRNDATGEYDGIDKGMAVVAEVLERARLDAACEEGNDSGGIEGVIGFSQGGCMAALLAAALERPHSPFGGSKLAAHEGWVKAVQTAHGGGQDKPLKFAVVCGGFRAAPRDLQRLYAPKVKTPVMHCIGTVDTVVAEDRSMELVRQCEEEVVYLHPGAHFVPIDKAFTMTLAGFIFKNL